MFCQTCLREAVNKLLPEDIEILEYLKERGAILSQCSISRSIIKDDKKMTPYKCFTILGRLEYINAVGKQRTSSNKYFLTSDGKQMLEILEEKLQGVDS